MKTGIAFITLITLALGVRAQENDDMYFTAKDRVKLNSTKVALVKSSSLDEDEYAQPTTRSNDSYSGRGENPEYSSKSSYNGNNQESDAQYFVSGYQPPVGVNQNQYDNSNYYNNNSYYGNPYNSSYYSPSYFGGYGYSPYSSFYSPYSSFYGGYSSYGGFGSGLSIGYTWGMGSGFYNAWNYGGYGSMWGNPYYSSFYGNPYFGYNSFYGYGYGYPGSVVIINNGGDNGGRNVTYGRRSDRSQSYSNTSSGQSRNASYVSSTGRTATSSAGRTSSDNQYYDRSWRSNSSTARSSWSNAGSDGTAGTSNTGSRSSSNWGNSWNNGGNTNSRSTWGGNESNSGSRSSWSMPSNNNSFGGGGGGRSSGGGGSFSGGGSSSGSGSRGRH